LDLGQLAVILLFAYVFMKGYFHLGLLGVRKLQMAIVGTLFFIWLNVIVLRALHHYQQIAYDPLSLWGAIQVQMSLSILWSVCALVMMTFAGKFQQRQLWLLGAALLAVELLKLFTVDLSGSGSLSRIVSFMAVGGFMLLIGYLSPIPAKKTQ
jgi:uncharacterized membrane protein